MAKTEDLVHETSTTTGTGNFTLANENGRQSFNDAFGTGGTDLFYYYICNGGAAEWELGTGHLSASTTLVRDTVINSSNAGSLVNFSAGSKDVTSDIPADYQGSIYVQASAPTNPDDDDIWVDTDDLSLNLYYNDGDTTQWVELGGGGGVSGFDVPQNLGLAASAASGALTITLTDRDGNTPSPSSPVRIPFRNSTLTNGTVNWVEITSATTLVVSSGSTLGVTSSTAFRLWVVLFDDGQLGVINCSTSTQIYPLTEWGVATSTAEGGAGAADSAGVLYTTSATSSDAYRIIGFLEWSSSGLTAGTWTTTNLNRIQLFGPGVHKPGEVIQTNYEVETTQFSTTSNAFQTTNTSVPITPSSAANKFIIHAAGGASNSAAGVAAFVQIHRDSTAIGSLGQVYDAGGANSIGTGMLAFDAPNTTSSITYAVKLKNSNNATTVYFAFGTDPSAIHVQEVMG